MKNASVALASVPLLTARGLLSLCFGIFAFSHSAPGDTLAPSLFQLQHTSWTERDGAPPQINDIAQAPDGSLWLGSGEGLYRFDGFTFEPIRAVDGVSPAPTEIHRLLATKNGDLWVGSELDGVILLRNGAVQRFPKFEGLPLNTTVNDLAVDLDGTIWAATALGLQRFDGSEWRHIGKEWGLPEWVEFRLQADSEGSLWIQAYGSGLYTLKRGSRHFEHVSETDFGNHFFDQSPSGEDWASTAFGICPLAEVLADSPCLHSVLRDKESTHSPLHGGYLNLVFDRRGNLWMTSWGGRGGIKRVDSAAFTNAHGRSHPEETIEAFAKPDGLTSDGVRSVFRDRRDGSIWVGTDHGLDHFRESPFVPVFPDSGANAFGIQPRRDGRVWVGSSDGGGLWIASPEGKIATILADTTVASLYEAKDGTLWFATYPPGVASISDDHGKSTRLSLTPELHVQVSVQSIAQDRDGGLWVSFIPYGLAKWDQGQWIKNGGLKTLPDSWAVILNLGPDGRLWAGYLDGEAAVIDGTSVRRYAAEDLNIGPVAAIYSAASHAWLAGPNGLLRFDGQHFHLLLEESHRPLSGITGVAEAKNGDLWLNAWNGVRRVAAAELKAAERDPMYAVHSELYDLTDGLPSVPPRVRPFPTAVSASDGRIWFGLRSGAVSVDPEDPALSTPVPPVSIVRAIADGKSFDITNVRLAARTRNLEIDYSAVSLNRASRVRFRYKLEGLDAGWRDAGSRRQAFYNDPPPGKYRFVVSASNGDDIWNEVTATMNMEVAPAFDQTIWFKMLCIVVLLVLLWALYRYRLYQIRHVYDARLEERLDERTRIARDLHDTLLQTIQGSKLVVDDALDQPNDVKRLRHVVEQLSEWLQRAIQEGRTALNSLREPTIPSNDLAEALKRAIEERQIQDPRMEVTFSAVGAARELHPLIRNEVYQIVDEAIRNAWAHSRGSRLQVELNYGQDLVLRVCDNGVGMDSSVMSSGKEGHFGLQGMRERISRIGGALSIVSSAASGTQITIAVPGRVAFRAPRSA